MTGTCPDGAVCTHSCELERAAPGRPAGACWRMRTGAAPQQGAFPGDEWPAVVRRYHTPEQCRDRKPHNGHDACPGLDRLGEGTERGWPVPPMLERTGRIYSAVYAALRGEPDNGGPLDPATRVLADRVMVGLVPEMYALAEQRPVDWGL